MSSYESAFVGRVAAMESLHAGRSVPENPILAAQRIIATAEILAQVDRPLSGSPLRYEAIISAPRLKRNYGSVDLNEIASTSSSAGMSNIVTSTDTSFPMQLDEDEGELIEQDISPPSSAPGSPVLEFSTRKCETMSIHQEPLGVMFGSDLAPEFIPVDEVSDHPDYLDTLEDCDSLGHFAEVDMSPADSELHCAKSTTIDSLLISPKPLFEMASPRITQGSWGLTIPAFGSAFDAQVVSPVIGPGSFETLPWIPAIASLALVANVVMGPVY
ncbi:hypothetical protein BN14_04022 [Rhizoctonia solani AG-1 IB]|uniref:Uncharacterized protein n=1 Tax=Thanatephorus cucumeris (strain AG1-IB / isolate 7/3/14) TaxID=1108050 RepID=M5BQB3_THACB|nr:hypothetical protein BN14_04022 [Rhizoctonia solani AG-1 IB]